MRQRFQTTTHVDDMEVGKKVLLLRFYEEHLASLSVSLTNEKYIIADELFLSNKCLFLKCEPHFFELKKDEIDNLTEILMELSQSVGYTIV